MVSIIDCDGTIDQDWSDDVSEPNETAETLVYLGHLGGDSGNGESSVLTIDAYLYDANDVDALFYTEDEWNDAGFDVLVDSVAATVDIAFSIDFVRAVEDTSGDLIPYWAELSADWRVEDDNGPGEVGRGLHW